LLRVERRLLEEWGQEYAEQWAAYHQEIIKVSETALIPELLEVSFGRPHSAHAATEEPTHPCLTMGEGEQETRIRGRIDRIDKGQREGQVVFNVIDYKTGYVPSAKKLREFHATSLQLDIYTAAAEDLLLVAETAIPWNAGYWQIRKRGFH